MDLSLLVAPLAISALLAIPQDEAVGPAYPGATPIEVGLSPESLKRLDSLVASLVEEGEVVGAELLVIKEGKTVLHSAHGWRDQEEERAMEVGSLFCVRSMTKPFIGTSILMLADDKALRLDDPVSKYLPYLDNDTWREVTIEQMLNHNSGLPFSLLMGKSLDEFGDIHDVAKLTATYKPDFEPGTGVQYSDQGTDTLTAVVEVASGMPAEDFVRTRILEPLGMSDSRCLMTEEEPLRARSVSKYVGGRGQWNRFWGPEDPSIFPCFLGSQGLYSTLEDYAKFLDFWMSKGRAGGEKLLSARRIRKALAPGPHRLIQGTGFADLRTEYGYLMSLYMREQENGKDELAIFGHSGSDGTHAWAFPEEEAIVLYFTQSRGSTSGLRVEEALDGLLLGAEFDPNIVAPPLEDYLGYYRENEDDLYRAIVLDGSGIGLEILGKTVVPLQYVGNDTWKMLPNPSNRLAFHRDENGRVLGYRIGDHQEYRFDPDPELPSADEVVERVIATHGMANLEESGPIRIKARLEMSKQGFSGTMDVLMVADGRFRVDYAVAENTENIVFDGEQLWYASSVEEAAVVEGERAAAFMNSSLAIRLGDWRKNGNRIEVIQRLTQRSGRSVLVVRSMGEEGYARTRFVDEESGYVGREDSISVVPGMGVMGEQMEMGDFKEVGGMTIPHRMEIEYASPLLGTMEVTVDEVELNVELLPDSFKI